MDLCQADKIRHAEFFGPGRFRDPGLFQQLTHIDVQCLKARAQHFAALTKGGLRYFCKACQVDVGSTICLGPQLNHSRGYLGRRGKGAAVDIKQDVAITEILAQDG